MYVYKNVKWLLVHAVSKRYKTLLIRICINVYLCNIALPRRMAESRGRIFHIKTRLRHSEQANNHLLLVFESHLQRRFPPSVFKVKLS